MIARERSGLEDRTDPGSSRRDPVAAVSHRALSGRPFERSSGGERFCHSFSSRSDRTVTDSRIGRFGVHADARAGGDGHRAVGRELERLGEVLVEVAAARARIAGEPEVRHRREREVRRPPIQVSNIPPHQTGTERSPSRRPCGLEQAADQHLLHVHDPAGAEADRRAASAAERIDSSNTSVEISTLELGVLPQVVLVAAARP